MPAITTPEGLPCPQDMSTDIVDTRLQTPEGGKGPIEFRTIERDERQVQQLAWTLNAEQAAIFRAWWTDTLVYGGAWFSAPENWPCMEGRMVKVRRFITPPQWRPLGLNHWHVSITAELRGETLLPLDGPQDPGDLGLMVVTLRPNLESLQYAEAYESFAGGSIIGIGGTFDPENCGSGITLSNGNLTASFGTGGAPAGACQGTAHFSDLDGDRCVFEFVIDQLLRQPATFLPAIGVRIFTGISPFNPEATLNQPLGGNSAAFMTFAVDFLNTGNFYGESQGVFPGVVDGDVVGYLFDAITQDVSIFINGEWVATGAGGNNEAGVAIGYETFSEE